MPRDNNFVYKQSRDPSSDNSEASYKKGCEKESCSDDHCTNDHSKKCECYSPEELACLFKDAVVEVHSEFILLGTGPTAGAPVTSATGGTPLSPGGRTDVILEGNGFFIKGHYIIAPAQLVLLPPSLTSVVNRYPFLNPNDLALGQIKDQLIRASRILISVFNVNGKGHSFVYEADLVGVDGAADVAVLRINYKKQWNLCNPCVEKCHPYFNFGSSRASKDGEKVYLIGDYVSNLTNVRLFNAVGAICDGLLSDHRYLEYAGLVLAESVLVSAPAYAFSAGLPILNCQGQVIGMQTTDIAAVVSTTQIPAGIVTGGGTVLVAGGVTGVSIAAGDPTPPALVGCTGFFGGSGTITSLAGVFPAISIGQTEGCGFVSGPSEFFMRRIIKALIKGTCSRQFNCQIETVCDPAGAFYRYKKSYAGIAYDVFTGSNYDTTTEYIAGTYAAGLPRVRLTINGEFLNAPSCKELIGIRVLGVGGLNANGDAGVANGLWYVPGGTGTAPLPNFIVPSPFLGKLLPGDVITHINGVAIGDLNKQIAPSLITWRLCAGDQLEVCYRRGGNAGNTGDNGFTENYDNLYTHTVCLADFPFLLDYPWYAINRFPLLVDRGFGFPVGQLTNPQLPARAGGAFFHPAF